MTAVLEVVLFTGGVCLAANLITGLVGRVDPERRVRNGVPALILAVLAFGAYAVLIS